MCNCGCFNQGNLCSSEHDDRQGSLEVSAVAVMENLKSTVRLRASKNDRVEDRGTPEVEAQTKNKCSNEGEESGNVGKRDDAMHLRWNVSRRLSE